ncbi:MAG: rhodanese-like domain-containing protein [Planctomycetota bacterium]|nr:rhodanese-like domain-containing protein [Planctomycetota bacterium]
MPQAIDVRTLSERLASGDGLVLLDCRTPEELRIASIPGALHIPMHEIPGRLDDLDREAEYAVMCHHGVRSAMVCRFLAHHGFARTLNVSGGIDAYARVVDPSLGIY